jgi:hypothetical protein
MGTPNVQICADFLHDTADFLERFRLCEHPFRSTKWRRVRLCMELRFSYECALKSVIAYARPPGEDEVQIVDHLKGIGHDLRGLARAAAPALSDTFKVALSDDAAQLDLLPVDLRYRVESNVLTRYAEHLYCQTAGSDDWMERVAQYLQKVCQSIRTVLDSHSQVVHVSEIETRDPELTRRQMKHIERWWGV